MRTTPIRLAFILLIAVLFCAAAAAEEPLVSDYRSDFYAYARAVAGLTLDSALPLRAASAEDADEYALCRLLIKTDGSEIEFTNYRPTRVLAGPKNRYTLQFDAPEAARACREALASDARVLYAEPDSYLYPAESTESEITYHSWGASRLNYADLAAYANQASDGTVLVAIIDSGMARHSFLMPRVGTLGYDYIDNDTDPTNDTTGHGTHVAGIIADCTQGANVKLMPIRVMNAAGGLTSNFINAMEEARLAGAKVINASLTSDSCSKPLENAIAEAVNAGVTVVMAAGNGNTDVSAICPAHMAKSGFIVVASLNYSNGAWAKAAHSNYGTTVDIGAPGNYIYSCSTDGGYVYKTGTSMATPHISAVCALMKLIVPAISPSAQESRLNEIEAQLGLLIPGYPQLELLVPAEVKAAGGVIVLREGETLENAYSISPSTFLGAVALTNADASVASLDGNAVLTAVSAGETTFTVSTPNALTAQAVVKVVTEAEYTVVSLPPEVTDIGGNAFLGNAAVYEYVLPEGVLTIGEYAFSDCANLCRLNLPELLTYVADTAFDGCPNLIVYCAAGGYAEAYCQRNGIPYILK